jgi:CRISPR/Cas system-associated protein Cas10 (large subunit of type III CRISPR-Cas system)
MENNKLKKLLHHIPLIASYIHQKDELRRCRKQMETLQKEINHLDAAKVNHDFDDFTDFCRKHGITIED